VDRTVLMTVALSLAAIVAGVQTQLVQRIIGTRDLELDQWLICLAAAAGVLVAAEARAAFARRTH
jgi:hypothetical protein